MNYEYECALSGLTQAGIDDLVDAEDDLLDMPVGWTKLTLQRREYNPKWLMLQEMKQTVIRGMMAAVPEEVQQNQGWMFGLQAEAQFYALEKDTPQFLTVEEVVYLSDNGEVREELDDLRESLGLSASDEDSDDDEDLADESHLPHDGEFGDDEEDDDDDDDD